MQDFKTPDERKAAALELFRERLMEFCTDPTNRLFGPEDFNEFESGAGLVNCPIWRGMLVAACQDCGLLHEETQAVKAAVLTR